MRTLRRYCNTPATIPFVGPVAFGLHRQVLGALRLFSVDQASSAAKPQLAPSAHLIASDCAAHARRIVPHGATTRRSANITRCTAVTVLDLHAPPRI